MLNDVLRFDVNDSSWGRLVFYLFKKIKKNPFSIHLKIF